MQTIELDNFMLHMPFKGTDGNDYVIEADVVAANDMLVDIGDKYKDQFESRHEIDKEIREWAAAHGGGECISASCLLMMQGAIRKGFEEFKKKADPSLISQIFMESTPSLLSQLKDGHLKLASQESSPKENSDKDTQPQTLPQTGSTG